MKHILVIAKHNQAEALRVAAGLTLLNDAVRVIVPGPLAQTPAVTEQTEVLDFAEVPCEELADAPAPAAVIATAILESQVLYVI
ncbi:MAG: hypothetical protein IPJ28_15395 [Betaproteobacteria bacterium]|nr:hypothetical protein [Betaproteobacteria bacterium]